MSSSCQRVPGLKRLRQLFWPSARAATPLSRIRPIGAATALLVLLGALSVFAAGGNLKYDAPTQSVSTTAGSATSFTEGVTAPKNSGTFSATLHVTGTGSNPIPAAWVSAPA